VIVTLLTDFGDADGFVGAMRGVLLGRAPGAVLADIAHHVPPGDVAKAARVLRRAAPCFPAGTIHLVVVDPGVGSARRPLALRAGGHTFVGPDNGVLIDAAESLGGVEAARALTERSLWRGPPSSTFHGRDVFAPVAGALAAGVPFERVGPPVDDLVRPHAPAPAPDAEGVWRGRVVEVDRYGNLITDLPPLPGPLRLELAGAVVEGPSAAYADVVPGALVLVVGSEGTLEVAVRDDSAAARLGAHAGTPVACVGPGARPSSAS
jgi:S-adenosylmethionine hydrolase